MQTTFENFVEKEEIVLEEQFLPFPQCFQMPSASRAGKVGEKRARVNSQSASRPFPQAHTWCTFIIEVMYTNMPVE